MNDSMTQIKVLRYIVLTEGLSFLALLLIAMPLKYYFGIPVVVKWVGWMHGALFMAYIVIVLASIRLMKWNFISVGLAFLASIIPFGTFFLDKSIRTREEELRLEYANK
jgi:integral membrane protein